MKLTILGTGNANAVNCYNTCFALSRGENYFLVDAGGGNTILRRLGEKQIRLEDIHDLMVTHEHIDHLLGVIWLVRMIGTKMNGGKYTGVFRIYAHPELCETIEIICRRTIQAKVCRHFGTRILLCPITDGGRALILGREVRFFDILSTKAKQFGFTIDLGEGKKLTCLGDEPYNPQCRKWAEGSAWLMHEAFCLYSQREKFRPYEKHHSTVREACVLAEELGAPNLILYHTEDTDIPSRKLSYTQEGKAYYTGNLLVPEDGEEMWL